MADEGNEAEDRGSASPERPASKTAKKATKKPKRKARKRKRSSATQRRSATPTGAPWTFPKVTLEKAITLAQAIEEKNAGRPLRSENLAPMVAYRKSNDWRYLDLLRAANQYGLVSGSGATVTVALTEIGSDIVAPSSPNQRQSALLRAFNNVDLFARVAEFYSGKKIPEDEYFGNTLTRDFGVPRERVTTFIEVFTQNLEFLKAFASDGSTQPLVSALSLRPLQAEGTDQQWFAAPPEHEGVREFLDTCFILMPFGEWYDRYFREIYVPATKDAGFEPLRADGLFSVGSVMEQIWAQIRKAKVLLADLTNRNPNVFYELGLAHAIRKPVVFVAGSIDDVPFDVRHLRVVVYDIREPNWAEKLRRDITTYLKNTRLEPEKSIPQPYREISLEDPTASDAKNEVEPRKQRR